MMRMNFDSFKFTLMKIEKIEKVFLGDEAFALKNYLMKPYPQRSLTVENVFITTAIVGHAESLKMCLALFQADGVYYGHQFCWLQR